MVSLEQVGSHEWQFVYPEQYEELMEEFHQGVELLEGGRLKKAERIFRQTLAQMPDHLDASTTGPSCWTSRDARRQPGPSGKRR